VLLTLAILGIPTAVYAWGRNSAAFDVKTVRVSGARLVPEKTALTLLQQAYVGANLFSVTAADVRKTLRPLAFVESVKVDRDFPDTLVVGIAEYVPAAYALAGGRWYVVDAGGHVICTSSAAAQQLGGRSRPAQAGKASPSSSAATPATHGMPAPTAAAAADGAAAESGAGSRRTTDELLAGPPDAALALPRIAVSGRVRQGATLSDADGAETLRVIAALPGSYRRRLAVVEDDRGQLTLRFAGGPLVTWGDAERTLAKTIALRTVLAAYAEAGKACTEVDVSIPDRTLARPVLQ
jgi:hypothetical protein